MSGFRSSYIGAAGRRQPAGEIVQRRSPPFVRAAVIAVAMLSVTGCARLGLPFEAGATASVPVASAKPVVNTAATTAVDPSDWRTVRETLAGMASTGTDGDGVDWRNPTTGSAGTIIAYAASETPAGLCRDFATTVNDIRGVRRYRGQACVRGGDWKLTGVAPEDGKLL